MTTIQKLVDYYRKQSGTTAGIQRIKPEGWKATAPPELPPDGWCWCSRCKAYYPEREMCVRATGSTKRAPHWGVKNGSLCADCHEKQFPAGRRKKKKLRTVYDRLEEGYSAIDDDGENISIFS
jgi:hypothetical protein